MRFAYCLLLTTLVLLHGAFPAYGQEQTTPPPSSETTSSEKPSSGTSTPGDTLDAVALIDSMQSSLATIGEAVKAVTGYADQIKKAQEKKESEERAWNAPYAIAVGSSLDLLNGARPNDLYTDVRLFLPRLFAPEASRSLGLDAGITSGRTISLSDSTQDQERRLNLYDPALDSLRRVDQRFGRQTKTTAEFLSLHASVTYPLIVDKLYLVGHAEYRRRDIRRTTTISIDSTRFTAFGDTVLAEGVPFVPLNPLVPNLAATTETQTSRQTTSFGHFGVGLLLDYADENLGVRSRLKAVFGFRDDGDPFYMFQFQLDERKFGLRLGGEIHGLLSRNDPALDDPFGVPSSGAVEAAFAPPTITIYLAKVFSLRSLGNFLGS